MRTRLGIAFGIALFTAACSPAATTAPTASIDYAAEYLEIAAIYNTAVDTWDGIDRNNLEEMTTFAGRMAVATRRVEERLVEFDAPDLEDEIDELIEVEAEAHVAFLVMAVADNTTEAEKRLVKAFEIYTGASEYSEVIRVRLGLPSVEISPHHYL